VTGLGKLFRTTAFKLSLAYLLVFALFAAFVLGYVAWNARQILTEQIQETIEAETNGLAEQYRLGGIRRLVLTIERRTREPGASLYLVTTYSGERLAGNVEAVPPGTLDTPGNREIDYARSDEAETRDHRALVRIFVLPGGFRLLVGRDVEERERLKDVIRRALGLSLGLITALACLGGWFITRRVLKRVEDMTATTQTIMAGDLSGRLAIAGTGDELDRLAQNLNVMLDRIGELMAGLKEVSDNIAHDLKTPLNRLRNRAEEALRTAKSPDDHARALEATIDESDNLIRIFNALLMIARLEAGGEARETMADFDAAEVAKGVAELYEPLAEEAGVPLVVTVHDALPVHGSRELLGQALSNLVDNAIKYGAPDHPAEAGGAEPVGDATVTVTAERNDGTVAIAVADRGIGIPESERAHVLQRFVRLEGARTRPGFGLGLSLAAAVARLHGGELRLEDNSPGLRAVLLLPAKG
jgi:signal transduction histidine kinase